MKRFLSLALSLVISLSAFAGTCAFAQKEVTVEIDGSAIEFDVKPEIIDGRTMVPLRKIFESIGALVKWNNDTQTVSARKNSKTITLVIGSDAMQLDKGKTDDDGNTIIETIALDVPARVVRGRTLVPTRAVSESFGLLVDWDEENQKVIITSDDEEDDSWKENQTSVNLTKLSFEGKGVEIKDKNITITEGGDYTLTGELSGGSITVSAKEKVKLRLSGVTISSDEGPCIFVEKADKAYITISKDTQNTLAAKNSDDGAIYSKENLEIKGEGKLSVESEAGHGIKASDNLVIEEGNITINSANDGIHINDTFKMKGGVLNITSVGDGIDSESIVNISGGEINVKTTGTPIEAKKEEPAAENANNNRRPMMEQEVEVEFEKSTKGINAEWMMCLNDCKINVNSASHSVHCEDEIEIKNVALNLSSEYEKGISAHGNLTISGSETLIDITKSTEGIESKNVMVINDGVINIVASDDAINATGGKSGAMFGMGQPPQGGNGQVPGNMGANANRRRENSANSAAMGNRNSNRQNGNGQPGTPVNNNQQFVPNFEIPGNGSFVPWFQISSDGQSVPGFGQNGNDRRVPSDGAWRNPANGGGGQPNGGFMGGMRANAKDCLIINGGTLNIFSGDDGLDSNGNLIINAGTIKAGKSNGSFYGAFGIVDPDGQLTMSDKANLIFTAPSGNERSLKLTQNTVLLYCSKTHEANETITVTDKAGNVLYEYSAKGNFATVLIASNSLQNGENYTIKVGDESYDVSVSSQITTVGTPPQSGGFGRGGFGR